MKWFFRHNGLSVIFLLLFLLAMVGQIYNGLQEHNQEMREEGGQTVALAQYLTTGHFFQATFENWESEFLQMGLFVVLTISFYQKGSSQSKDPDSDEEVDKKPNPRKKDVPWPVRQGGLFLHVYKHSLSIALFLLFVLSFVAHWLGSLKDFNQNQTLKHLPTETALQYLSNSRLWFESFQNWQSEFLSVFAIVLLSIHLRQQGSPQSKPVDAPNQETGA